ncbi:kelch-like protein 20 [Gouania willdenowi]|uniref:kelch-like protein 20 n=1 Tax=Gouania willdenowi TaxID=441366 RepID=UPI0010562DC5|nr:kelch-like protein 20 [Gouania willdenowi]
MGIFNEQGASVEEPESRLMLIKDTKAGLSKHRPKTASIPPSSKDDSESSMFMVGGWSPDDPSCLVEQFLTEYNEWRTAARMVRPRGGVAVGTLGGKIYTVGGEDNIRCYNSVERYSPETDSWSTDVAPLSSPRTGVCLVTVDQYLYAIGGHDGISSISTMERYDPKLNTWSKQAPMLTRRTRAVAAVLGGFLYVMGGNDGDAVLNSVERYSPVDGTWSICAHMLCPRENAGCAAYLGHIYVAGGKDELNLEVSAVERFDPETMRWIPVRRMQNKRNEISLVVFSGTLMAVGGSDGVTSLKTIEVYNHESNTWRHFGSMKSNHPGGRVAVLC